jgi:NADH-quinone oxidoreductase subunit J
MLGSLSLAILNSRIPLHLFHAPLAQAYVEPVMVIVLCVLAGLGTVLLLPSRLESAFRGMGGVLLLAAVVILSTIGINRSEYHMSAYFWIFAFIALAGAVRVVTHSKPVYAALYFVLTVFATAGLFILLSAEFMAVALVIIYAGAILITYVFVIMLASQASNPSTTSTPTSSYDTVSRDPLIACTVGFALMGVMIFVIFDKAEGLASPPIAATAKHTEGATQELGHYLFQNQTINLELSGLILTLSMVGAIVIARKRVITNESAAQRGPAMEVAPMTPLDDSPHSIPVYGTTNPRQKEYPET